LEGGYTFAKRIAIESNVFVSPATDPFGNAWKNNFLNLGGVDGLTVRNNSFTRRVGAVEGVSAADVVVYSSKSIKVEGNRCYVYVASRSSGSGIAARAAVVPCVMKNASGCAVSVSKC
jgi:hypothetical protein